MEQHPKAFLVLGSRQAHNSTRIKRHWYRHIPGRVFATLVNWFVLNHTIYDTQCGAKLMSRQCVEDFCQTAFTTRWLFDIELIMRIASQYPKSELKKRILEISISQWIDYGESKIRFIDWLVIPFELLGLVFKK